MKIKQKLTLRYIGVTALVLSLVVLAVILFAERTREREFYRTLTREAVTKANLFLSRKVDAATMQSIYRNNKRFINEVEVALYSPDLDLIYHDAPGNDIAGAGPELIRSVAGRGSLEFYEGKYQCVAMPYSHDGRDYVVTAAAYDGYGYATLERLALLLAVLWGAGLVTLAATGYFLAGKALKPIKRIVCEVDSIGESNLGVRLQINRVRDELDELSDTFNRMLDRLEHSIDNHKMFVSNIAHELRTPLSALIAELEVLLLREQRSEGEYRTTAANVLDDARKIKLLISGLLDLARANYGIGEIATERLRLDELLLDARETVLKANGAYSVELIFDQDPDDEEVITVVGNEYLLKTAFVNLIDNNCKFSDNGASYIQISFLGSNSIVRFSDSGVGIASDELERIFMPFYRGSNSGGTRGQGIGLALTRRIIQLHNGSISVLSEGGQGTTFVVELKHV